MRYSSDSKTYIIQAPASKRAASSATKSWRGTTEENHSVINEVSESFGDEVQVGRRRLRPQALCKPFFRSSEAPMTRTLAAYSEIYYSLWLMMSTNKGWTIILQMQHD